MMKIAKKLKSHLMNMGWMITGSFAMGCAMVSQAKQQKSVGNVRLMLIMQSRQKIKLYGGGRILKVKEIAKLIPDKIILYKQVSDNMDFINLYKGDSSGIPDNIADMEIRTIGSAKKGIVDIQVT